MHTLGFPIRGRESVQNLAVGYILEKVKHGYLMNLTAGNPGNSGGPVFDPTGAVSGIVVARPKRLMLRSAELNTSQAPEGLLKMGGFAIATAVQKVFHFTSNDAQQGLGLRCTSATASWRLQQVFANHFNAGLTV